jgi:hypothetical protein
VASNLDTAVGFLSKLARTLRTWALVVVMLSLPIIVGLTAAYFIDNGSRMECVDSCHPAVPISIRGECHCAVEGGWMIPAREPAVREQACQEQTEERIVP